MPFFTILKLVCTSCKCECNANLDINLTSQLCFRFDIRRRIEHNSTATKNKLFVANLWHSYRIRMYRKYKKIGFTGKYLGLKTIVKAGEIVTILLFCFGTKIIRPYTPPNKFDWYILQQAFSQNLVKRVSKFAGNLKTGCPNCSLTIHLHINDR